MLLWCVLLLLILFNVSRASQIREGFFALQDFVEYWSAVRVFIDGGNPYSAPALLEVQKNLGWTDPEPLMMWNPPWVLPLLTPLYFLPFPLARLLWFLASGILCVCAADFFWRSFGGPLRRRYMSWVAVVLFLPTLQSLLLGQISPLILIGLWGFLWALKRNRPLTAGTFTVLISIKPHLLFLFWVFGALWILKNRKWGVFYAAVGSLAIVSAIVLAINPNTFNYYCHSLNSGHGPLIWKTPTWGTVFQLLFPTSGAWIRSLPSLLGIVVAFALWKKYRGLISFERWSIMIPLLCVITGIFSWTFDWVVLLPLLIYLLIWSQDNAAKRWWMFIILLLVQPALLYSIALANSNLYGIWFPPLLWGLYYLVIVNQSIHIENTKFA